MKFKYLDKWIEQKQKINKADSDLREREAKAQIELQKLYGKYEDTLKDAVTTGKDNTKELDEISGQIEGAIKTHQRRREERVMNTQMQPNEKLKPINVVDAWNQEYVPQFRSEKLEPAIEELINAKKHLANAMLDYFAVVDEYEYEKKGVIFELGESYQYKFTDIGMKTQQEIDKHFITSQDLWYLSRKQLPPSYKQIGGVE